MSLFSVSDHIKFLKFLKFFILDQPLFLTYDVKSLGIISLCDSNPMATLSLYTYTYTSKYREKRKMVDCVEDNSTQNDRP